MIDVRSHFYAIVFIRVSKTRVRSPDGVHHVKAEKNHRKLAITFVFLHIQKLILKECSAAIEIKFGLFNLHQITISAHLGKINFNCSYFFVFYRLCKWISKHRLNIINQVNM